MPVLRMSATAKANSSLLAGALPMPIATAHAAPRSPPVVSAYASAVGAQHQNGKLGCGFVDPNAAVRTVSLLVLRDPADEIPGNRSSCQGPGCGPGFLGGRCHEFSSYPYVHGEGGVQFPGRQAPVEQLMREVSKTERVSFWSGPRPAVSIRPGGRLPYSYLGKINCCCFPVPSSFALPGIHIDLTFSQDDLGSDQIAQRSLAPEHRPLLTS